MPICRFNSCIERSDAMFCEKHRMAKNDGAPAKYEPEPAKYEPVAKNAPSSHAERGRKGGKARAAKLTPERRSEIARNAIQTRWAK